MESLEYLFSEEDDGDYDFFVKNTGLWLFCMRVNIDGYADM